MSNDIVEKARLEKDIEVIQANVISLQKRLKDCFTAEEKGFIEFRIQLLEANCVRLLKEFEKKFHKEPELKVDLEDAKLTMENIQNEQYVGLKYDVDNPDVKKRIGRGLSYDSGYSGYTEKEARDLRKLLY